ncbi:hypothetical protein N780_06145 [Pontibacillus chungwhensis BH030062]|uniref:Uncharacterized protein n=1 Tax=Pontibacillus chungwhensis BH030062 TaxID=1385513 RepID=A0A0A2V9D1_9BACI|nr:hypothetical protein N780_06145 [Pontibacillus chungwhensis BH030062]
MKLAQVLKKAALLGRDRLKFKVCGSRPLILAQVFQKPAQARATASGQGENWLMLGISDSCLPRSGSCFLETGSRREKSGST